MMEFTLENGSSLNTKTSQFACTLVYQNVKIDGTINGVMNYYRERKLPNSALLTDYSRIYLFYDDIDKAFNAYAHETNRKLNAKIERGNTVYETAFMVAASKLKNQLPTDVVCALFYPPHRNDFAFECSYLIPVFAKNIEGCNGEILIINPSPNAIAYWLNRYGAYKTTFAVTDNYIARIYEKQFQGKAKFIEFGEINKNYEHALLFSRDLEKNRVLSILIASLRCNNIVACIPDIIIKNDAELLRKAFDDTKREIDRVLIIPTNATNSTPRKKLLVSIVPNNAISGENVSIYNSYLNKNNFFIENACRLAKRKELLSGKETVRGVLKKLDTAKVDDSNKRNSPLKYHFSKEIIIFYTYSENRKNRCAAKAYYREAFGKKGRGTHGRRIGPFIEKGLRASTKEKVISNIGRVPFYPELQQAIIEDIIKHYSDAKEVLSLKTVWFCCRPFLLNYYKAYNDEDAFFLFCGKDQSLSNLVAEGLDTTALEEALISVCLSESTEVKRKHCRTLSLIFSAAIDNKYVSANPAYNLEQKYSSEASARQKAIRDALTKKNLSLDEEEVILNSVFSETDYSFGSRKAKAYEACYAALLVAMRLFSGMTTRECCALTWGDISKNEKFDLTQILIYKYNTKSDGIITYIEDEKLTKIRTIPLVLPLAKMLEARKEYLKSYYRIEDNVLDEWPVFFDNTSLKPTSCIQPSFCDPRTAATACEEYIGFLKNESDIVILPADEYQNDDYVIDLINYQGDILYSNFKHKSNHTAYLWPNEINYYLGKAATDTYSMFYCDFSHELIQLGMCKKLQRWVLNHKLMLYLCEEQKSQTNVGKKDIDITAVLKSNMPVSVDITLPFPKDHDDTLTVEIDINYRNKGCIIPLGGVYNE